MKGFEPRFADFPDYILKITEEIWEGRKIASLHTYYSDDIVVRTPQGISFGNADVISSTLQTLAELPDRVLLGEDVIWSGTPETGLLSSHRILSTATHLGSGGFGPASGARLTYRAIANCHAIDNQINDEWLIRDTGAVIRQIGGNPRTFAAGVLADEAISGMSRTPFSAALDRPGPAAAGGNDNAWGARYADTLARLMSGELDLVARDYDRAVELFHPGGAQGHGHADAERFWIGLRASFPNADFTVQQVIGQADAQSAPKAALFFALEGRHEGHGTFGPPSGAQVHVMGAAHAEFGPRGIRREWVLFDEIAIWKQILSAGKAAHTSA